MYTRAMFGNELKKLVLQKESVENIGDWANEVYYEYCDQCESGFKLRRIMVVLSTMSIGPEFAFSYEMLNKIADDLIAGKDVDLDSKEYKENL